MAKIKDILAGRIIEKSVVKKQQLSSAMAWQILNKYPTVIKSKECNIYKNLRGVLLADEVGAGKTFEALTLITKSFLDNLNLNKRNFRVIIVANPAIRSKWEWSGNNCDIVKFFNQVIIKNGTNREKLRKLLLNLKPSSEFIIKSKKQWKKLNKILPAQCIILSSIQALPPTMGRKTEAFFMKKFSFPQNKFNWIIADEAHIVKSGYTQTEEDIETVSKTAVRKLYALLNSQEKAKLLLLTATPFHNKVSELKQMISLLDHKNIDGVVSIIGKGLEKLQVEFNELKESVEKENNFSERLTKIYTATNNKISLLFPEDNIFYSRPKCLKNNGQRDGLDDFLRDVMIRNRKEKLGEKTKFIELTERDKLNYLLLRDLILTEEEFGKRMISTQLCQLVSNPESLRESFETKKNKKNNVRLKNYDAIINYFGEGILYNLKRDELLTILKNNMLDTKNVVTVFCRFIPGIKRLKTDLEQNGFKTERLDGTIKVDERKKILKIIAAYNKKNKKTGVLLVSQVGNEGLDFDQFSDTIIHFDGHYNPAVIAQRNGRVYRRENKANNITVFHLLLKETYDQRIKFIEEEKKKLKDFYLGDGNLEQLFEEILNLEQGEKKKKIKRLLKFKIDLEPKKKYLLRSIKTEVI